MESGRFLDEEHHHHYQQFKPPGVCCCGGSNSTTMEVKEVQDLITLFTSYIAEVKSSIQEVKSSIPEEVERAVNRALQPYLPLLQTVLPSNSSSMPHQAESSVSRSFHLSFKGELPDTLLTMDKIEDEGASLTVELCDNSGKKVDFGPEYCLKVKIEVLDGDFEVEDRNDLTVENFSKYVAKPRKDKGPLLKGNCEVLLSGGCASVCGISFTDNSKSMRNGKFRLGALIIKGLPPGIVVRPAVTNSFRVKECRLKSDQKHPTPSPEDELWRLVNISKTGPVYRRALENDVRTVKDFLQLYHTDPKKMQNILDVPDAKWKAIVKNAEACKLTDKCCRYYDDASGNGLLLDCAFNIVRVSFMGQMSQPFESLDDSQKEEAYKLRRTAYAKRSELETDDSPSNQITVREEPAYPSSIHLQEKEQQQSEPTLPHVGTDPNADRLSEFPDFDMSTPLSELLRNISFTNKEYDFTPAQGGLVVIENGYSPDIMLHYPLHNDGELRACVEGRRDTEWNPCSSECLGRNAEREERGNVSVHGHATSKLLAACYVTKAATLFMFSVQQDPSGPKKKRKLQ